MAKLNLRGLLRRFATNSAGPRVLQICACNDPGKYQQYAASSAGFSADDLIRYDNCSENRPIPSRYNEFIRAMPSDLDAWLAFVHNDFQFHEDPRPVLGASSVNHIYGVVGANIIPADRDTQNSGQPEMRSNAQTYQIVGRVQCSPNLIASGWCGEAISEMTAARTLDCCCVIVHSSLIRRHQLRFNEQFKWHFYSEEFSLRASRDHGIESYVLPLKSGHYGLGATDQTFFECRSALYDEYPDSFASTCFNPLHQA